MINRKFSALIPLAIALCATAAPAGTAVATSHPPYATVPYASDDPNVELWNEEEDIVPEAIRGNLGGSILGPQNIPLELQNPSLLAPPTTDHGHMYVKSLASISPSFHQIPQRQCPLVILFESQPSPDRRLG